MCARHTQASLLAAALAHAPALTSLDASGNYIGAAGAASLAAALAGGCGLRRLSVADNVLLDRWLSDKGQSYDGETPDFRGAATLLAAAGSAGLTLLDLSHNHLGADGAAALAAALATAAWPCLTLVLGFNKLQAEGVAPLLAALRRPYAPSNAPPALGELNLRNNNLRPAGAAAVARALGIGPDGACLAVASLCLLNNHLLAEGGAAIGAALAPDAAGRSNCFLRALDVSSNCLGSAGSAGLAAALGCGGLAELASHRNNAGDAGAAALAAALATNGTLRALRLSNNHVHSDGGAALAAALRANASLQRLDLSRNHFSPQDEADIREAAAVSGLAREVLLGDGPI